MEAEGRVHARQLKEDGRRKESIGNYIDSEKLFNCSCSIDIKKRGSFAFLCFVLTFFSFDGRTDICIDDQELKAVGYFFGRPDRQLSVGGRTCSAVETPSFTACCIIKPKKKDPTSWSP